MDSKDIPDHAEVGPSSLGDIILCPGRVKLSRGMEDVTSFAAAQGSAAHAICENILNDKKLPKIGTVIKQDGHEIEVDKEMIDSVNLYQEHIDSIRGSVKNALCMVEQVEAKGSLDFLGIPEVFGTADYSLSVPFNTLYIRDFKYGSGIIVNPEYNKQLMCYALIAGQELFPSYQAINLGIVQPRGRDGSIYKVWETTPAEILKWVREELSPTVKLAMSDDAPLVPGEKQCKWCRASSACPALAKQALTVAQADFSDFSDIKPDEVVEGVSIEKVTQVYEKLNLLKAFIKAVEGRVFSDLEAGLPVPGYKLVNGRKSKSWKNEQKAEKYLRDHGLVPFEQKLLSPAKAIKELEKDEKKEVMGLIDINSGKPTIAVESDKRPAISIAADDFKNITN
jgi:hypothetical protein